MNSSSVLLLVDSVFAFKLGYSLDSRYPEVLGFTSSVASLTILYWVTSSKFVFSFLSSFDSSLIKCKKRYKLL
ncbi:hypothetical protein BpHYR1_003880 [Brachionus plicatilis]|uniref:Uncharacterized protein n=1 Tax=Brachionus plicatilis TaxID=10195 RepID=A0A3M7Q5T9_BRAPC|nr:hypothetical protein BpHYR1_003880 [Brachionus plicatilis]